MPTAKTATTGAMRWMMWQPSSTRSHNVQDDHWLVYCALGGREHYALADLDTRPDLSLPTLYSETA